MTGFQIVRNMETWEETKLKKNCLTKNMLANYFMENLKKIVMFLIKENLFRHTLILGELFLYIFF